MTSDGWIQVIGLNNPAWRRLILDAVMTHFVTTCLEFRLGDADLTMQCVLEFRPINQESGEREYAKERYLDKVYYFVLGYLKALKELS